MPKLRGDSGKKNKNNKRKGINVNKGFNTNNSSFINKKNPSNQ